jgi:hypothetical protein
MAVALPIWPHRLTFCVTHGLAVEILRCTARFWRLYKHLLELNGQRKTDIKRLKKTGTTGLTATDANDLKAIMGKMNLKPRKKLPRRIRKSLKAKVAAEFTQGFKDIDDMFKNLSTIVQNDETFLYRAAKEIRKLYLKTGRIKNPSIPYRYIHNSMTHFYSLMDQMRHTQHHAWVVAKAHARDFIKIQDLSILSTAAQRRRIRRRCIELEHIRERIAPLKTAIKRLRRAKTQGDINRFHNDLTEIITLYRLEIQDLKQILSETDVIIRRTEKLFKAIKHEAAELGMKEFSHLSGVYSKKPKKILRRIENRARREYFDINGMVKKLKSPEHYYQQHLKQAGVSSRQARVISINEHKTTKQEQKKQMAGVQKHRVIQAKKIAA